MDLCAPCGNRTVSRLPFFTLLSGGIFARGPRLLLLAFLGLLITQIFCGIARAQDNLGADLETIRAQYHLPGLSAVVIKSGRVVAEGAAGVKRQGAATPLLTTDEVNIASCTKWMTATIAARLVDRGIVSWTTRVRDIFPNYQNFHSSFADATLEQFLAHRTGMETSGTWDTKHAAQLVQHNGTVVEIRRWVSEWALIDGPEITPGSYLYSNIGYSVAAVMMEVSSGKSWETLIQEEVFDPLRMSSARLGVTYTSNVVPPTGVVGHDLVDATATPVPRGATSSNKIRQLQGYFGAGGYTVCTMRDWARFLAIHAVEGSGYLSAASISKLHSAYGSDSYYGFGVFSVRRSWAEPGPALTHSGDIFGEDCEFWMAPAGDLIVAVFTNTRSNDNTVDTALDAAAGMLIGRYKFATQGPLLDTNATLGFASAAITTRENDGNVSLTVTRPFPATAAATVGYKITPGSAGSSSDFQAPLEGSLSFAPGETSRTLTIPLVNDSTVEPDEQFAVELLFTAAAPAGGYSIEGTNPATVTIVDDEVAITATALPSAGGSVTGDGIYPRGGNVTLTATAQSGYVFVNWTEAAAVISANVQYSFIANQSRTLVANFLPVYSIVTGVSPEAGGTVSGGGDFQQGSQATVTAQPTSGFIFSGWLENGTSVSDSANYTFTVTSNRSLTAHFVATPPPNTPQNISPANGATGVPTQVTLQASNFSNPYAGHTHAASQWIVTQVDSGAVVLDSGETSASTNRTAALEPGTLYRWEVRYKNSGGIWSSYSTATQFETGQEPVDSFAPYAGTYLGLGQANTPDFPSTGHVNITVTKTGKFTAAFKLGAKTFSLTKTFDAYGLATGTLNVKGLGLINLRLLLDTSGDGQQISGTISGPIATVSFLARKAIYSTKQRVPVELVGKYTVLLPPGAGSGSPGGTGFGKVTIGATGSVSVQGKLGDGTSFNQSTRLTAGSAWPLFTALYSTTGSVSGWLYPHSDEDTDLEGELRWFKLPVPAAKVKPTTLYPAGFSTTLEPQGSRYTPPIKGVAAIEVPPSTGLVTVEWSSHPGSPLLIAWAQTNKITAPAGSRFTLSITASTGLFSGSCLFPGETKATKFFGALFQKHETGEYGSGAGYYLRGNNAETISFSGHP